MKKVLITGATGFIGQHAIAPLINRGYEIHATSMTLSNDSSKVQWHLCDLLNLEQTTELLAEIKPTHLLHFAWYAIPGKYWTSTLNIDWVKASLHLLQKFGENGGKRVVMAGTCAEYDWTSGTCHESQTPLEPSTLYGTCKAALSKMLMAYSKEAGLSSAWGRIFHLYGPKEYPQRLTPTVIQSFLKKEIAKCSHGTQIRDFLHVEDVADAFVTLLDSEIQGAVNIGSGQPVTLKEVIEHIACKLDSSGQVQYGPLTSSQSDPKCILANVNRLFDELNWRPKISLDQGLNQTIAWWQKNCDIKT